MGKFLFISIIGLVETRQVVSGENNSITKTADTACRVPTKVLLKQSMKHLHAANSATTHVRTQFEPFGALAQMSDLDRLWQSTAITARTAISYHCTGQYAMHERVIGDDMFYCITRGKAEIQVEGQKYFLSAGDCAHFARGVRHAAFAVNEEEFEVDVLHYDALVFGGLTLPRLLDFQPVFHWDIESTFIAALKEMCRIYALQPAGWQQFFNATATQFLWNIVDHFIQLQTPQTALPWRELERLLPVLYRCKTNSNIRYPSNIWQQNVIYHHRIFAAFSRKQWTLRRYNICNKCV